MRKQPHQVGVELHKRASEILTAAGKGSDYSAGDYLRALANAESEIESDVPSGPELVPDEHGLEGAALATVTNRILESEGREDDAERFLEVFTALARRHALYGYMADGREDADEA